MAWSAVVSTLVQFATPFTWHGAVAGGVSAGLFTSFAIGVHDGNGQRTVDVPNGIVLIVVASVIGAVSGLYWIPCVGCYVLGYKLAGSRRVVHSHVASTNPEVAKRTDSSSDDGRAGRDGATDGHAGVRGAHDADARETRD